jgi:hypothetical protein
LSDPVFHPAFHPRHPRAIASLPLVTDGACTPGRHEEK